MALVSLSLLIKDAWSRMVMTGLVLACVMPASGAAGDRIRELMTEQLTKRLADDLLSGGLDLAYGNNVLQRFSFWEPEKKPERPAPLILFVHGGGWKRGDRANATGKAKLGLPEYPATPVVDAWLKSVFER